jgi:hypothetical protein
VLSAQYLAHIESFCNTTEITAEDRRRLQNAGGAEAFRSSRSYLSTARKQGHSPLTALERVFAGKLFALNILRT